MSIPSYSELMLPVLRHCSTKIWYIRDLVEQISNDLKLTEDERSQPLPGGGTTIIASRVQWARTYLKQAGIVDQPKRGFVRITDRGTDLLRGKPSRIDSSILRKFPEFLDFQSRGKNKTPQAPKTLESSEAHEVSSLEQANTPEERIASAASLIDATLRDALLARVLEQSPSFFEKTIIDLLLAMGYGGSQSDAGERLGGSGDGGVDGLIREDQLGLDRIYLQAKRYQPGNTVGPETVQAFVGALVGKGAHKGVLITTSSFSKAALNVARQSGSLRLVLIDGDELTRLMTQFNVGVREAHTVKIKRVDLEYFAPAETE